MIGVSITMKSAIIAVMSSSAIFPPTTERITFVDSGSDYHIYGDALHTYVAECSVCGYRVTYRDLCPLGGCTMVYGIPLREYERQ